MSDYDSQLPIRSKQDVDERVLVKLQDGVDPSGVDKTMEISEKKAHIRNFGKDSDGNDKQSLLSQEGHTQSNGDYDVANNKRPSSQGLIASDRDASPSESTMNQRPTAVAGDNDKIALDVAISDSSGNHFSETNPLPTYQAESPFDEIDDFDEAVDVVKASSANHDYTVSVAKTLKHLEAEASASGKARFELQVETAAASGVFDTIMVKFNSTAKPNVDFKYAKTVATGVIIRVVKKNLDGQNPASVQSLYSQIRGKEI